MARAAKRKAPARVRYEQGHPTVSCRVAKELYDQLQAAKEAHRHSFADYLKLGMERQEVCDKSMEEARKRGWDEGRKAGFTKGQKEGWNQGHEKGVVEVRTESWRAGHEKGFAEGREKGLHEGLNQGFDNAKVHYRVGYQCNDCGLWIWAENPRDKQEIAAFMKGKRLGHIECPRRRN